MSDRAPNHPWHEIVPSPQTKLYTCGKCGAAVVKEMRPWHEDWHRHDAHQVVEYNVAPPKLPPAEPEPDCACNRSVDRTVLAGYCPCQDDDHCCCMTGRCDR